MGLLVEAMLALVLAACAAAGGTLIPPLLPQPQRAQHYYTTWATQGYMPGDCVGGAGDCVKNLTVDWLYGHQGATQGRCLNSSYVFGKPSVLGKPLPGSGWARDFYKLSRAELYFMLDEGYAPSPGTVDLDPRQFPEYAKLRTPAARLTAFQKDIRKLGWRGLGLWQRMSNVTMCEEAARWSKAADIRYWKTDGPDDNCRCSGAAKAIFPELWVEHGKCAPAGCPLNHPSAGGQETAADALFMMGVLGCSDIVRTYDTVPTLSIPITLSRLAMTFSAANKSLPPGTNKAMLNADAESYVGASMGALLGPMRSPRRGLRPKIKGAGMSEAREVDLFFMGNRDAKYRIDEIDRAVRWGRIAPPFGARAKGGADVKMSHTINWDSWAFEPGDTWDKSTWGSTLRMGAPAVISRGGLPLATVSSPSAPRAPAPATLAPCGAGRLQEFVVKGDVGGCERWSLRSDPSACLSISANSTLVSTDCASAGRFQLSGGLLQSCGSGAGAAAACAMASCNCAKPSCAPDAHGQAVRCGDGAQIVASSCGKHDARQLWSATAQKDGEVSLELTGTDAHHAGGAGCRFVAAGKAITASNASAKVTGTTQHALAVAKCVADGEVLEFTVAISSLTREIFVGVVDANYSKSKLSAWVNTPGSWGYSSNGERGSSSGYSPFGGSFKTGDFVTVRVYKTGTMAVGVNGKTASSAIFSGLPDTKTLRAAVWLSAEGSRVDLGSPPASCVSTAAPTSAAPYVVTTRYPNNGAVSITTLGRTICPQRPCPNGYRNPPVHVTQDLQMSLSDAAPCALPALAGKRALPPIAAFGVFTTLTLVLPKVVVGQVLDIQMQDLRANSSSSILAQVTLDASKGTATIPGSVFAVKAEDRSEKADISEPGVVMVFQLKSDRPYEDERRP